MADTIQELYQSFATQMEPIQEEDRYFRYLYEMAQASDTTLEQKREVLVKKVDERWISTIEDAMDSIFTITANPRRFVTTEEELVPVSLARKISSESIRHLSMNTQYIDPSDDGEVHPSKILNVSTQETFDLYENRFIFHLIKRLITFVDKRTDVIFWQTNNEVQNHFVMHTQIDDAYETITYDVNMIVKNKQSTVDNEADNMDVFMRIDRIRRQVLGLRRSAFYELMDGCAKVRSPIQRTNLIMKDPDYRKCYQLWQFIEGYDEVGYTIEIDDSEMAFDEEYMVQMYTNLVNNYAVFKTLTLDERNLSEIENTRHEVKTPVFIKEIEERFVDDCNIPDVEIRQVFVDEVTEKQLAAEAALAEEQEKVAALKTTIDEKDHEIVLLKDERHSLNIEIENSRAKVQEQAARVRFAEDAKAKAEAQASAALQAAGENEKIAQEATKAREEAEAIAAAATKEAESTRERAKAEIDSVQSQALQTVRAVRAQADEYISSTREQAEKDVAEAQAKAAADVEAAQAEAAANVKAAQEDRDAAVKAAQEDAASQVAAAQADRDAAVKAAQSEATASVKAAKEDAAAQVAAARAESEAAVAAAKSDASIQIADIQARSNEQVTAAKADAASRIAAAEEKATLSVNQMKAHAEETVATAKENAENEVAHIKRTAAAQLDKERAGYEQQISRERDNHAAELERERRDNAAHLKEVQDSSAEAIEKLRTGHATEIKAAEDKAARELADAQKQIEELKRQLKKTERERDRAQRKAEGNSVSRLLRKRLQGSDATTDEPSEGDAGSDE